MRADGQGPIEAISKLTPAETRVLHCVLRGMTDREIADLLFKCSGTVKQQRHNLREKLGIVDAHSSNWRLFEWALRNGLVSFHPSLTDAAAPPSAVLTPPIAHGSAAVLPGSTRA